MTVCLCSLFFFFFKQKTAYEMRISDWSSDVCSSDLAERRDRLPARRLRARRRPCGAVALLAKRTARRGRSGERQIAQILPFIAAVGARDRVKPGVGADQQPFDAGVARAAEIALARLLHHPLRPVIPPLPPGVFDKQPT